MNAKALIRRTRDGEELTESEIRFLVNGAVSGEVLPYQLTAWMMAAFLRGLTPAETTWLTRAMLESGRRLSFPDAPWPAADKHSTGGVGDKISLLVAPLVAAAGVPVPMISGRSLGHTGGTLDKLESIPGFRTSLPVQTFVANVKEIGVCIAAQNADLAPADRILYELRDAASIVESVPLITASILCKKAAAGVRVLAVDVKFGRGAFMPDRASARALAAALIRAAAGLGIGARAHLTRMDCVLGRTAGNALEIEESAAALRGERTAADIRELTLALGGSMLALAGAAPSAKEGERRLEDAWRRGEGYERFLRMVRKQGGDVSALERGLPRAARVEEVKAGRDGAFLGVDAREAGTWIMEAGGGRLRAADPIDPRIGIEITAEPGTSLHRGETAFLLHLPEEGGGADLLRRASSWIVWGERGERPGSVLAEVVE